MADPNPADNPPTTGLADGNWWLIVWSQRADEASAAIPLGARREWSRSTLRLLSTHWQSSSEVVDDSAPWGRIYLNMADMTIYLPDYTPPEPQTPHERMLAVNVVYRGDEMQKTSLAEAWLAVRGELSRRETGRGAGQDGEANG
jgi:hypothetical protein